MSRLTIRLPSRDFLGLDSAALERELQQFIQSRHPESVNSFFEGDTARILIEFLSYIGDTLSYNVGRVGEESFIATARERDSALRHAATFGYPVRSTTGASAALVPDLYTDLDERITSRVNVNEVQRLTLAVTGGAPSGTFTLTYNAETSIAVTYPPDSADVTAALESISQIGNDNVVVTNPLPGVFDIEFVGDHQFVDVLTLTVTPTLTDVTAAISVLQEGLDDTLDAVFTKGEQYPSGGLTWEILETVIVDGSTVDATNFRSKFTIPVVEGVSFSESFLSSGRVFQTWVSAAERVVASTITVQVGDVGAVPWTQVDTIAIATAEQEAYELRFDNRGRIVLRFGDGITGKIPPDGSLVIISGRSSSGVKGNAGIRGIRVTLNCTADDGGTPVLFTVPMVNVEAADGGMDAEALDELRRNIPRWVRTVDKAITKEDYDTLGALFDGDAGTIARAASYLSSATILYQTGGDAITPADPLVVPQGTAFAFDGRTFTTSRDLSVTETDPILFFNPNVVYVYLWALGETGFEGANETLRDAVRVYLQDRSVITTTIKALPGRQKVIDVNLGEVKYEGSVDETTLFAAIVVTVRAFFVSDAIQPGMAFRISDLYNVVENTANVGHFVMQTPTNDVAVAKDEIAVLGTLTFTLSPIKVPLDTDANAAIFGDELFS